MTSTTTPKAVSITVTVESGDARIWTSITDGFYDPNRFPEHLLIHCKSGEALTEELEVDSGRALVVRIEDALRFRKVQFVGGRF